MSQPKAIALEMLQRLYAEGNPQAKSYALVGIRSLYPETFKELLSSMSNSSASAKVQTQSGCIVDIQELRIVAKDIRDGRYDYFLNHPFNDPK